MSNVTYTQGIYDPRLYDLSHEAGLVYSKVIKHHNRIWRKKGIWLKEPAMDKLAKYYAPRKLLHSQSYQASYQKLQDNFKSWQAAKKAFVKNPSKFSGKPKMPSKTKWLQPIQFKSSAIKLRDGIMSLSLAQGNKPIEVKWSLEVPKFVTIIWSKEEGWKLNCVIEKVSEKAILDDTKTLGVDLGIKRLAVTFDGVNTTTYNGKHIKSLVVLRNKMNARTQYKLSKMKKGGKNYKEIRRANRFVVYRIQNKIKDALHKTSKAIVNQAIEKQISKINFGDCSAIHINTKCGKRNNQAIQQSPEQKLKQYVSYKFKMVGGSVATVSERYSTQECPCCKNRYKPSSRYYSCRNANCNFKWDRDGIGASNIWLWNQSIVSNFRDLVGGLTPPRGYKYNSQLFCNLRNRIIRRTLLALA
jgi:putative transposase